MNFLKRIKLTYEYFKSLGKKQAPAKPTQSTSDIKIRPDVFAFLTYPYPIPPSESAHGTEIGK